MADGVRSVTATPQVVGHRLRDVYRRQDVRRSRARWLGRQHMERVALPLPCDWFGRPWLTRTREVGGPVRKLAAQHDFDVVPKLG